MKNPHFSEQVKTSKQQTPHSTASDDIVMGSVDLQTLKENVGRFHIQQDLDSSDKQTDYNTSVSEAGAVRNQSDDKLSSISISSLPDLVQQYPETLIVGDNKATVVQDISQKGLILSEEISPLKPQVSSPMQVVAGMSPEVSSKSPPLTSLAQLQDPETFTIGSPDAKSKNKITKANFGQAQGSLQNTTTDPTDPFSSLDPMWSLGK